MLVNSEWMVVQTGWVLSKTLGKPPPTNVGRTMVLCFIQEVDLGSQQEVVGLYVFVRGKFVGYGRKSISWLPLCLYDTLWYNDIICICMVTPKSMLYYQVILYMFIYQIDSYVNCRLSTHWLDQCWHRNCHILNSRVCKLSEANPSKAQKTMINLLKDMRLLLVSNRHALTESSMDVMNIFMKLIAMSKEEKFKFSEWNYWPNIK